MKQFARSFGTAAIACAALLAAAAAHAQTRDLATNGQLLDRVAAVVNDGVVLTSELDDQMALITSRLREQKLELPPENVLRQQVLERLITQEIEMQRAKRANLNVPDETLNNALSEIASRNKMTLSQLPETLASQGIDYASYREGIRKELVLQLLRQRDVIQRISVTPREIDQFLERQSKLPSESAEYNVSHILIAVPQAATVEQLEDLLDVAIAECERFYPTFQFVIWGGKRPEEALQAALLETVGEA